MKTTHTTLNWITISARQSSTTRNKRHKLRLVQQRIKERFDRYVGRQNATSNFEAEDVWLQWQIVVPGTIWLSGSKIYRFNESMLKLHY